MKGRVTHYKAQIGKFYVQQEDEHDGEAALETWITWFRNVHVFTYLIV